MNKVDVRKLSDQALVNQFREYALDQESALLDSDTATYNRLYDKMKKIDLELRARGPQARRALLVLLDDPNLRVRYEAAMRCAAVDRNHALTALNEIVASNQMPEAGWAGMALSNLEDGIFNPS